MTDRDLRTSDRNESHSRRESLPTILHATEAFGGGVTAVIDQYRNSFAANHVVLARARHSATMPFDFGPTDELVTWTPQFVSRLLALGRNSDIIHLHSSIAGGIGRLLPAGYRRKIVYTPHALPFLRRSRAAWAYRSVERILVGRCAALGAVSQDEADNLVALGGAPSRIVVVPHALEVSSRVLPRQSRARTVVGVGRIAPQKDPLLFAEIARKASDVAALRDYRWVWIGDGDRELARRLAASGVEVTGWLSREEVASEVAAATMMLHTAAYEGLPVAVLEAMRLGTPVVVRAIPSVRELACESFERETDALRSLRRLLKPHLWSQQSMRGRQQIERSFSMEAQRCRLGQLYELALR